MDTSIEAVRHAPVKSYEILIHCYHSFNLRESSLGTVDSMSPSNHLSARNSHRDLEPLFVVRDARENVELSDPRCARLLL